MIISNPKRPLDRAVETSRFDWFCYRIAPYVIGLFSFILIVLALVILVKYGGAMVGTEANRWYYGGIL